MGSVAKESELSVSKKPVAEPKPAAKADSAKRGAGRAKKAGADTDSCGAPTG